MKLRLHASATNPPELEATFPMMFPTRYMVLELFQRYLDNLSFIKGGFFDATLHPEKDVGIVLEA